MLSKIAISHCAPPIVCQTAEISRMFEHWEKLPTDLRRNTLPFLKPVEMARFECTSRKSQNESRNLFRGVVTNWGPYIASLITVQHRLQNYREGALYPDEAILFKNAAACVQALYLSFYCVRYPHDESRFKRVVLNGSWTNREEFQECQRLEAIIKIPFGRLSSQTAQLHTSREAFLAYLENARHTLDNALVGQTAAKAQTLNIIVPLLLRANDGGGVIAIQGPSGIGKATFARDGIAKALGRPCQQIWMSGLHLDIGTFVGHDISYTGAWHGVIVECLERTGCMDPVICFNDLDSISDSPHGQEVWGLLLHLLHPPFKAKFIDRFIGNLPIDLSRVLVILTFENREKVYEPLLERIGDNLIRMQ